MGVGFSGLRVEQHQAGVLHYLMNLAEVAPQLGLELGREAVGGKVIAEALVGLLYFIGYCIIGIRFGLTRIVVTQSILSVPEFHIWKAS